MTTPSPAALVPGFITNATKGSVSGSVGALQSHDYVSNDTKAQIETAGYFNPIAAVVTLKKGDTVNVTGDIDGTPFITSYVLANVIGDVTVTEHAAVVQNSLQEITMTKISTKAADAEVYRYVPNAAGSIKKIRSVLNNALATADATITIAINGTPVTNGVLTLPQAGSAAGNVATATPTAASTYAAGSVITATVGGGSTATGTANVSLSLSP